MPPSLQRGINCSQAAGIVPEFRCKLLMSSAYHPQADDQAAKVESLQKTTLNAQQRPAQKLESVVILAIMHP